MVIELTIPLVLVPHSPIDILLRFLDSVALMGYQSDTIVGMTEALQSADPIYLPVTAAASTNAYQVPILHFPPVAGLPESSLPDSAGDKPPVVIFMPALGTKAGVYKHFGRHLSQRGIATVILEQRGHGFSTLRASRTNDWGFREWIYEDLAPVKDFVASTYAGSPVYLGGHSLGGHVSVAYSALGFRDIDGLVLVASATPFANHFPGARAKQIRLLRELIRISLPVLGYYPGHRIGFGGREATTIMREWSYLARYDEYKIMGLEGPFPGGKTLDEAIGAVDLPVFQLAFADDDFAPLPGLDAVRSKFVTACFSREILDAESLGTPADHYSWTRSPASAEAIVRWIARGE